MNYLLYQAYRNQDNIHECLYSLYTLVPYQVDCRVVIYTDRIDYFGQYAPPQLDIQYRTLKEEEIDAWQGPDHFVHRFKICMLIDFVQQCGANANILYVDTDVVFERSPQALYQGIGQGQLWMHLNEGNIIGQARTHRIFQKVSRFLRTGLPSASLIPQTQDMWNAGALGFRATDLPLLEAVLELTDQVYPDFESHVVEQLAFSVVLSAQPRRPLVAAEPYIFHYWNFKEFRRVLKQFFAQNQTPAQIEAAYRQIDPIRLIQPKLAYENLGFIPKTIKKMQGKWDFPDYEI